MTLSFIAGNQLQLLFLLKSQKLFKGNTKISYNCIEFILFYSDNDEVSKSNTNKDSSDDDDHKDDDEPTDDISGDEFIPKRTNSTGKSLTKGSRVFAKWVDGNFYPGIIGNINGGKCDTKNKISFFSLNFFLVQIYD